MFINYMGPVNFNSLPMDVKKKLFLMDNINIKKCINDVIYLVNKFNFNYK